MSNDPLLEERYFDWLYGRVALSKIRNPARRYYRLCEQLFQTEFRWFVPNDDNRVEDARELRQFFMDEMHIRLSDDDWYGMDASVLEVLIALSDRLSFEADGAPDVWFWHILDNLDLHQYNDAVYTTGGAHASVEMILNRLMDRTYSPSGHGGLFPLERAREDQTTVEIWYQMSAYLLEMGV